MDGFTPITPGTLYSKGRGYGLKNAHVWRAFDVLQPDPLYQDFICIESGGLAVDVPNGRYRVFVNIDNPSGFWGEYQVYRQRAILAQGKPVVSETMDFDAFQKKYYRFWNVEDLPGDNTFDKYQKAYFHEKTFDVDVTDGQLKLDFQGENWACSVSAVVIFPVAKAAEGERFLKAVEARRRFYFDNYFKRVLHRPTGDRLQPTAEDRRRGYVVFQRDEMEDVYYNDTPRRKESRPIAPRFGLRRRIRTDHAGSLPACRPGQGAGRGGRSCGAGGNDPCCGDRRRLRLLPHQPRDDGGIGLHDPSPADHAQRHGANAQRHNSPVLVDGQDAGHCQAGALRGLCDDPGPSAAARRRFPLEFHVRKGTLDAVDVPAGPWG